MAGSPVFGLPEAGSSSPGSFNERRAWHRVVHAGQVSGARSPPSTRVEAGDAHAGVARRTGFPRRARRGRAWRCRSTSIALRKGGDVRERGAGGAIRARRAVWARGAPDAGDGEEVVEGWRESCTGRPMRRRVLRKHDARCRRATHRACERQGRCAATTGRPSSECRPHEAVLRRGRAIRGVELARCCAGAARRRATGNHRPSISRHGAAGSRTGSTSVPPVTRYLPRNEPLTVPSELRVIVVVSESIAPLSTTVPSVRTRAERGAWRRAPSRPSTHARSPVLRTARSCRPCRRCCT